ncbi:FkbM family methyltransferase [Candidatus Pelagibacter ubique]|nr:FkbM family methyltransferase [Candidatus Pelagibacter ubique]
MSNFGLVVIGAHSGVWLKSLFEEYQNQNILLVEPVPYNIALLKENTAKYKNINIETSAVSENNEIKKFYYVKPDAVKRLGKHWASGIGSFNKQHILNHKYKRFKVSDSDIEHIDIQYLSFSNLMEKYSVSSIDLLQIDVEGAEFDILNSINFEKIEIKKIIFEFKHFDGTFKEGPKLKSIKEKLIKFKYQLKEIDKENILAEKN